MNIFIRTYHMVKTIIDLPMKMIKQVKNPQKETDNQKVERMVAEIKQNTSGVTLNKAVVKRNRNEELGLKKITFNYTVKNDFNQIFKSSFDAYSKSEVEAFLTNEGYTILLIEARKSYEKDLFPPKLKNGELSFALTQLSTYIKAGIPLIDAVRILSKQTINTGKRKIYERVVYDLTTGENFSVALENQSKVFPRLLINMVKTAEMTGDLAGTLDDMSDYYTSIEETRKQMVTALTYPAVIFVFAVCVVSFILIWVVPNFVSMYSENAAQLPGITIFTMNASAFLTDNYIYIVIVLLVILLIYSYLYKNIKSFRKGVQTVYMKLPVIGNIMIYNEVTMFTKTFASLLSHSVNITDSMEILSKISNNEVYKEIITDTLSTLSKGGKISESFRGKWAFPVVAYEMLVTGESTGQLALMMDKVADHFANLHRNAISSLKSLIEPVTIAVLAVAVGFILLSIVIPMFDMFTTIV
ncbi:MAG: type II secretion system F family protein [Bacilli bacterium]